LQENRQSNIVMSSSRRLWQPPGETTGNLQGTTTLPAAAAATVPAPPSLRDPRERLEALRQRVALQESRIEHTRQRKAHAEDLLREVRSLKAGLYQSTAANHQDDISPTPKSESSRSSSERRYSSDFEAEEGGPTPMRRPVTKATVKEGLLSDLPQHVVLFAKGKGPTQWLVEFVGAGEGGVLLGYKTLRLGTVRCGVEVELLRG